MARQPLSARLRPEPVVVPRDADGVRWRRPSPDDVDAMLDCARAMDAVDHPDYTTAREEIADEFERAYTDPARDLLVAEDPSGAILAQGIVMLPPEADSAVQAHLFGGVRPSARGRGLGRALLAWQTGRALERLATVDSDLPGWITVYADDRATSAHGLLERSGFDLRRWFVTLNRRLDEPIAEPPSFDDLDLRSPADDDAEHTRLARNAAFRDHWGSQPRSADDWALRWREPTARHDLSTIAVDTAGAVAGFVLVWVNPDDFGPQGYTSAYIGLVGTRAEHRRRGLASALLLRTLRLAAADGLERAVLDVDADSPTGAVGLYARLGFAGDHRSRAYVREV